jgi:glycosyltransferase involved in cell wall biosynthesis
MSTLALCIPAYNAEKYLPLLLTSAARQIIPFDEILVYNDCSTDNTSVVAEQYGVRVIQGDVNRGCSHGKNILAQNTRCDWIHFHDADDELLPNFTTLAHRWMQAPQCPEVILFNYEYRDYDSRNLLSIRHFDKAEIAKDIIAYTINEQINPFCGLYKKTSFFQAGGYDTDPLVLYNEDKAFHIRLAINGLTFSAENEISIINYRIKTSMSASNVLKCAWANYHVLEKTAATHGNIYPLELSQQLWNCIVTLAACQDWAYVQKAVQLSKKLGYNFSPTGNKRFRTLTMLNPYLAVWFQEKMIRLFKPYLRND